MLLAVPPLDTYSFAPAARVVTLAEPRTIWKAPDTTLVLLAMPPLRTTCWIAPVDIVVPLASPPLKTFWMAPELKVVA